MFGNYFYHQRIRKSVAMFGAMFNDIYIVRRDAAGNQLNTQKVPLSYAPKRKFLDRIRENPDLINDTKVAIKLPRMSFEITNMTYDDTTKINRNNTLSAIDANDSSVKHNLRTFAPYRINFQLSIMAKNQDDALQLIEQIVPYFAPQYTLTIKPFADYSDIKEDVPITLNSISYTDTYEGSLGTRRNIQYTLNFNMNINFYGATQESQIIRKSIVDIHAANIDSDGAFELYSPASRIEVLPNPLDVNPDSDYGFTTTIYNYEDSA